MEGMNAALVDWNALPPQEATRDILPCCGSEVWATRIASRRPVQDEPSLLTLADEIWASLEEADWLEAFRSHPRIGDSHTEKTVAPQFSAWSAQEQQTAATADEVLMAALKRGNLAYEKKFGRIFIVCAAGKSAGEILEILRRRLDNGEATELRLAAEEQRKIMQLRLKKWLAR
jgi:2-oxo-4-hydroxy-4-carboxy-5-ureidoimidazoline decarboxylase